MTTQEWLLSHEAAAESGEHVDLRASRGPSSGLVDWVRLFLLRRRIDAMLRDTVGPIRYEDPRSLPPHILKDIGLQPPM
ncbi:MAG: hypothetical protein JWQ89_576 [Devosia sp.]|uniref:hypothetical protein n=1 Tax=Devosia sp. TaxID=1871048 RepID=UPI00260CFB32|nr:hypothetical protein [Devosia sp.]MDB5538849.1 hypothetical protein [Devosia sp.]